MTRGGAAGVLTRGSATRAAWRTPRDGARRTAHIARWHTSHGAYGAAALAWRAQFPKPARRSREFQDSSIVRAKRRLAGKSDALPHRFSRSICDSVDARRWPGVHTPWPREPRRALAGAVEKVRGVARPGADHRLGNRKGNPTVSGLFGSRGSKPRSGWRRFTSCWRCFAAGAVRPRKRWVGMARLQRGLNPTWAGR